MMGAVEGPTDDAPALGGAPPASTASAILAALYRRDYGRLVGLASVLVDDPSEAGEVVHDAFARVLAGWDRVRDQDDPRFYVRQAVINGARGRLRRRRVARAHHGGHLADLGDVPPERSSVPPDESQRADDRLRVLGAIARLPRRQRECVVLRFYDDLAGAEIARTLGISEGSVKRHLSRGLASIKTVLEEGS